MKARVTRPRLWHSCGYGSEDRLGAIAGEMVKGRRLERGSLTPKFIQIAKQAVDLFLKRCDLRRHRPKLPAQCVLATVKYSGYNSVAYSESLKLLLQQLGAYRPDLIVSSGVPAPSGGTQAGHCALHHMPWVIRSMVDKSHTLEIQMSASLTGDLSVALDFAAFAFVAKFGKPR